MFECEKCGKPTEDVVVGDLLNMAKDISAICADCRVDSLQIREEDGSIKGYTRAPINPLEVAKQVNPDVSCDFCNKPDPQWLYDLKMDPLTFGDKTVDLGTRWTACNDCATDADEGSPFGTTLRMGVFGNVTNLMQIHSAVMENISNKRAYVRSDDDGVIKQL